MYICQLPIEMDIDSDERNGERSPEIPNTSDDQSRHNPTVDFDLNLLTPIIRQEALPFFEENCQEIYNFWSCLARNTFIPTNTVLGDAVITSAFTVINNIILNCGEYSWKSRLAYAQLTRVLTHLKSIIARRGRARRGVGQGNASVLIDLYLQAQSEPFSPRVLRQRAHKRIKIARRWSELIGGSVFLATAYNSKADMIM